MPVEQTSQRPGRTPDRARLVGSKVCVQQRDLALAQPELLQRGRVINQDHPRLRWRHLELAKQVGARVPLPAQILAQGLQPHFGVKERSAQCSQFGRIVVWGRSAHDDFQRSTVAATTVKPQPSSWGAASPGDQFELDLDVGHVEAAD